ncbi:MAG: hypothetical protein R3A51_19535 [Nannocystaceae bacterium]|nr:hypothetical protein [Myxococcales bacterium]
MTARDFSISRRDLEAHVESSFLVDVVGCCEERLSTGSHVAVPSDAGAGWGRVCPDAVVVGKAIAALVGDLGPARPVGHTVARVRRLGPVMVGEPLSAVATVRFRSDRDTRASLVTMDVSVQRAGGGTRLQFELALEVEHLALDAA